MKRDGAGSGRATPRRRHLAPTSRRVRGMMRRTHLASVLVASVNVTAVMAITAPAFAQDTVKPVPYGASQPVPYGASAPPPAPVVGRDVIYLKNGGLLRGTLIDVIPNSHARMQLETGEIATVQWSEINRIDHAGATQVEPPAPTPQAAPPRGPQRLRSGCSCTSRRPYRTCFSSPTPATRGSASAPRRATSGCRPTSITSSPGRASGSRSRSSCKATTATASSSTSTRRAAACSPSASSGRWSAASRSASARLSTSSARPRTRPARSTLPRRPRRRRPAAAPRTTGPAPRGWAARLCSWGSSSASRGSSRSRRTATRPSRKRSKSR